jgi:hypothetical protein
LLGALGEAVMPRRLGLVVDPGIDETVTLTSTQLSVLAPFGLVLRRDPEHEPTAVLTLPMLTACTARPRNTVDDVLSRLVELELVSKETSSRGRRPKKYALQKRGVCALLGYDQYLQERLGSYGWSGTAVVEGTSASRAR